jgi:hypothetical protein
VLALGLAASVAFLGDASAHRDGVGVWGPSRGPEGGWVTTVAVAPSETVYAGTYFGRLFKSVDGARTWHARNTTTARSTSTTTPTCGRLLST